jgi:CRP-like cAMP-binding protein
VAVGLTPVTRSDASWAIEVPSADPLLARLKSISALTADQAHIISAVRAPPRRLRARSQLGRIGDPAPSAYVIREGWAFAYTLLADGDRQVLGFLLPGDIVRVSDLFRAVAVCGIETITDTVVTEISPASVRRASRQWPELYEIFLRLQSESHSRRVEQLIDIARRDSRARVAHLLCKLEQRLMSVGLATPDGYEFPVNQYLVADALGLTAIHVNRVLRTLRDQEIVTVHNKRVIIHDRARLMEIASCDGNATDDSAITVRANRNLPARGSNGSCISC